MIRKIVHTLKIRLADGTTENWSWAEGQKEFKPFVEDKGYLSVMQWRLGLWNTVAQYSPGYWEKWEEVVEDGNAVPAVDEKAGT